MIQCFASRWIRSGLYKLILALISCGAVGAIACAAFRDQHVFSVFEGTKNACFAFLCCLIWSGLFNSIGQYNGEYIWVDDSLRKELTISDYARATIRMHLILCLAEAAVSTLIFHSFFDFPSQGMFGMPAYMDYGLTFFMILFSADMLGLAAGVICRTWLMKIIPVILIAQLLLSGCMFELTGVLKTVSLVTTAHYGYAALGSIMDLNSPELPLAIAELYPLVEKTSDPLIRSEAAYVAQCLGELGILSLCCAAVFVLALFVRIRGSRFRGSILSF